MKKIITLICILTAAALLFASCGTGTAPTDSTTLPEENSPTQTETTDETIGKINVGFLQGPTGMGAAYMMQQAEDGGTKADYAIGTAADPSSFTAALISGELDMAALPVNAAATLYAKTAGKVRLLAVNTLGVMYILDASGTVNGIKDLKGKTVLSAGQGSTPEYVLDYLLSENGLEAGTDVTVEYAAEHAEVMAQALAGNYDVVLLPEPFVTKLRAKNADFKTALDLTEEWSKLGNGMLLSGCVAVRSEFADREPEAVEAFLADYEASVNYTLENPDEAAALMEKYGIIDAQTAKLALPACHITFMAGEEMKENTQAYLGVLFAADAASIGGAMPGDDFYCPGAQTVNAK